jgi:hypothetical protein
MKISENNIQLQQEQIAACGLRFFVVFCIFSQAKVLTARCFGQIIF